MNEGETKSFSVLDKRLGAAFEKAEQDQKILEEKAEHMGGEMPIIKVLNEKIEEMKKAKSDEFKGVLYDANGDEIKVKKMSLNREDEFHIIKMDEATGQEYWIPKDKIE